MELIVPAAGLSTRFPGTKPKYLLTDTNNKLMIANAVSPYLEQCNVTIGILQKHEQLYDVTTTIKNQLGNDVNVIILPEVTNGPADTVYQMINLAGLSQDNPMLIKDCDSYFEHDIANGNYVCVSNVIDHDIMYKISNKSFVIVNEQNIIQNIIEKSIISNTFCVGGYKFNRISDFLAGYNSLADIMKTEFFISHVIQYNINNGDVFLSNPVTNYVDVGTLQDWKNHNNEYQ